MLTRVNHQSALEEPTEFHPAYSLFIDFLYEFRTLTALSEPHVDLFSGQKYPCFLEAPKEGRMWKIGCLV